jgi:hypothetical protein
MTGCALDETQERRAADSWLLDRRDDAGPLVTGRWPSETSFAVPTSISSWLVTASLCAELGQLSVDHGVLLPNRTGHAGPGVSPDGPDRRSLPAAQSRRSPTSGRRRRATARTHRAPDYQSWFVLRSSRMASAIRRISSFETISRVCDEQSPFDTFHRLGLEEDIGPRPLGG